jgi:hypothetical protein
MGETRSGSGAAARLRFWRDSESVFAGDEAGDESTRAGRKASEASPKNCILKVGGEAQRRFEIEFRRGVIWRPVLKGE